MKKYMIVTPSITHALKGRDALRRLGISARVERKSRPGGTGCGYGIVTTGDVKRATQALSDASVRVLEIVDY